MGTFPDSGVGWRRHNVFAVRSCRPFGPAIACSDDQPLNEESDMRQNLWKTLTFCTALAMTGLTPALVNAQDRPDDRRPDDHQVMKADIHRDEHKNDDQIQ